MKLWSSSDIFFGENATQVALLSKMCGEFSHIFDDSFNSELASKYELCKAQISVVLRFGNKNSLINTFREFDKKNNDLVLDMFFIGEEYINLYKVEFRHKFSHTIFNYISESVKEYQHKLINLNVDDFLSDLRDEMKKNRWLADDVDYSLLEDGEF